MLKELEKDFFDTFKLGTPVVKKWYYEGYYEDFYWQDRLENCTKILKYYKMNVDEFNTKLQETKLNAKNSKNEVYDSYTDSINTQWGRISEAFMSYPKITSEMYLELICLIANTDYFLIDDENNPININNLKGSILHTLMIYSKHNKKLKSQIKKFFKEKKNQ